MAAAVEHHWDGPGSKAWSSPATATAVPARAFASWRRATLLRMCGGTSGRPGHPRPGQRLDFGRSRALPDFGRRNRAALASRRRRDAFRQAGAINRALLKSGAHIGEMNVVRKHLSAIKGGRSWLWPPRPPMAARPDHIGRSARRSLHHRLGTHGRRSQYERAGPGDLAQNTRSRRRRAFSKRLNDPTCWRRPKPGDIRLARGIDNRLIATPQMSLEAAAQVASGGGISRCSSWVTRSRAKRAKSASSTRESGDAMREPWSTLRPLPAASSPAARRSVMVRAKRPGRPQRRPC